MKKYIAKKKGYNAEWDYFQDNHNDSPKWTRDKSQAFLFTNPEVAMTQSNLTGLYDIVLEEV
jgi:hypothetical protein